MKLSNDSFSFEIKGSGPDIPLLNEKINIVVINYFHLINNYSKDILKLENDISNFLPKGTLIKLIELVKSQHIIIKELINIINNKKIENDLMINVQTPAKKFEYNLTNFSISKYNIYKNQNCSEFQMAESPSTKDKSFINSYQNKYNISMINRIKKEKHQDTSNITLMKKIYKQSFVNSFLLPTKSKIKYSQKMRNISLHNLNNNKISNFNVNMNKSMDNMHKKEKFAYSRNKSKDNIKLRSDNKGNIFYNNDEQLNRYVRTVYLTSNGIIEKYNNKYIFKIQE